jgi:hypothetical protein
MNQTLEGAGALRLRLRALGHSPIPVDGKRPLISDWQKLGGISAEELTRLTDRYPSHTNTGVLTARMPVLDIDIKNQSAAEAIEQLVRDRFADIGRLLVRVGKAPKRAIPFQTAKPYPKISVNLVSPDGGTDQKIELLCNGQQIVVNGIHPETQKPYTWFDDALDNVRLVDLPHLNEAEAKLLVRDAVELLMAEHGYSLAPSWPTKNSNGKDDNIVAEGGADEWAYLTGNILRGTELHDSIVALAAKLVSGGMEGGAAVNVVRGLMQCSGAPRDDRYHARLHDVPRIVDSAVLKFTETELAPQAALPFIDFSRWDEEPTPEHDWAVQDRIPLRQTALFTGEGGYRQKQRDLASMLRPCPWPRLVGVIARDRTGDLHRRRGR